ncbi:MAG: phospho-sugar mutase [Thermogutta sp.]
MAVEHDLIRDSLTRLEQAEKEKRVSSSAAANIRRWLTDPGFDQYVRQVVELIQKDEWQQLNEAFWQVIPFGTGGRRGRMFPVGTNAINDRTIGESAQGVADYVQSVFANKSLSSVIAYDTRHRSRHFAELCAEVFAASGFKVYFLAGFRSTPELSFAVRYKKCDCGIIVTASHNPPSDNAVKVYWNTGGQVLPPHDRRMIESVMGVRVIRRIPFAEAIENGQIVFCQDEVDAAYHQALQRQSHPGHRNLRILYSPLHGVGTTAVLPALKNAGFDDVEVFAPHAEPSGDFPNVPNHVANPENKAVFEPLIVRAKAIEADIALATDPDCDRLGCAVPTSYEKDAEWTTLTGNQIGALLTDYVIRKAKQTGQLTPQHYVVETIVTTRLIGRIARKAGVRVIDDLMVGFKWIGGVMDYEGPDRFLIGAEESYGFLIGDHARDKDGAVAAMLLCELAAELKCRNQTLVARLHELFLEHGLHEETAFSIDLPGQRGMELMNRLMKQFRTAPPQELGGRKVVAVHDLDQPIDIDPSDEWNYAMAAARRGNVVILDLDEHGDNRIAIRPSGTEPKCKFYVFGYLSPAEINDLRQAKDQLQKQLKTVAEDLKAYSMRQVSQS